MRSDLLRILLLGATLGAPFLPSPWSALALLAILVFWLVRRPPRREVWIVGLSLSVSIAALAVRWEGERENAAPPSRWVGKAARQYSDLWDDLREDAATAAADLKKPPADQSARLGAFHHLEQLEAENETGRRSLLLLDPDGTAVAWAGEGLLHEFDPERVPRSGLSYQASFGAVTLLAVAPLPSDREARRPWRVVAGASFPTDVLPIAATSRRLRWSLVDNPSQVLPGTVAVPLAGAPTLVVSQPAGPAPPSPTDAFGWAWRLCWAGLACAFLGVAVMRGVALALPLEPAAGHPERRVFVILFGLAGIFAVGMAAALSPFVLAVLAVGLALAALGLMVPAVPPRAGAGPEVRGNFILGVLAAAALFGLVWLCQIQSSPVDLSPGILADPERFSLRVALAATAFGLLCLAGRRRDAGPLPGDRWVWGGVAVLLAGAAAADYPLVAVPLLAAGAGAAAVYADRRHLREGAALVGLALLAILLASGTAEMAYRLRLRAWASRDLLVQLIPPTAKETAALQREVEDHFARRDLGDLAPRSPAGLSRQDLAYTLWRGSPLARPHALSALAVLPREGNPSSFAFGLPSERSPNPEAAPERGQDLNLPLWGHNLLTGEVEVHSGGKPWGTVRYSLMPRPGFQVGDQRRLEEIEIGLLKGGPEPGPFQEELGPVLYALYGKDGHAALSPWEEAPPLPPHLRLAAGGRHAAGLLGTPSGPAYTYVRGTQDGWEVVYLPREEPLDAIERVADASLGLLLLLALCTPPVLLLALPRAAFRDALWRVVRSYSKRLIIVYTVLLLVPLLLLNAVLVRSIEDRLRQQQRDAGEAALTAAQKVLGENLANLPAGFGVDTALGDRLLGDLSEVVHHEMNLYYGSGIYASSKHELFAAGLLPNRIPGEIYSRLSLLGYRLTSRTNRVGDTAYLEIYAPLRIPGSPGGENRLFLSMPLLAQQEEASRELAHLRRHGLLWTLSLFILLVAVGTRLARNFTRPITELVDGTRRIAAGATSLDMAPTELELAALVEAVDDMAHRIARGREQIVREKQVVERVVENITSGVVSLDRDGRVLMHNRAASELLGSKVGESLEKTAARYEPLAPVTAFLRGIDRERGEMERTTVRLAGTGNVGNSEREWSLVWVPLPGAGEPAALLVVEDATEVLRHQRLVAWAEMARIIAHEIKNPLTPIRLSTEHMREVWQRDPDHFDRVFERCTANILTQVEELRSIASDFSAYSAILRIDPKPGDLTASMTDLVEAYRAAPPNGVRVGLETNGPVEARFDAKLLGRAVRNLLENALRAAAAGGGEVVVRVDRENGSARIAVEDNGPGVRPENLLRIFDPYFSTHDTGTGLGLPIARRVVEEHGGHIAARNREGGGLEVVITLPV